MQSFFALKMPPNQATIRTYATSANLGPLFDMAGAKLDGLYMTTSAKLTTLPELKIAGSDGQYPVPTGKTNIARIVAREMFNDFGIKGGLEISVTNDLKFGGLGASGASVVAIVELINYMRQLGLTTEQKIRYALLGEPQQHPDNVVPCILGGIVLIHREEAQKPTYEKLPPVANITPAMVIPYDIFKSGGTAQARKVLEGLTLSEEDKAYKSESADLMISGLRTGNFEEIFEAIRRDNLWEKSVTYVRNQPTAENPNGIYGIDVHSLNKGLEAIVGKEAILTPSGAGPAMLILAKDKDVAKRAQLEVVNIYMNQGHQANGFVASIRNTKSEDDFI